MPEISRFLGISIYMYFTDHNPPHIHVRYNNFRAIFSVRNCNLMEGTMTKRAILLVKEWMVLHQHELYENWESLQWTGKYKKIQPLE